MHQGMTELQLGLERMSISDSQQMIGPGRGWGSTSDEVLENTPNPGKATPTQSEKPKTSDEVLESEADQIEKGRELQPKYVPLYEESAGVLRQSEAYKKCVMENTPRHGGTETDQEWYREWLKLL